MTKSIESIDVVQKGPPALTPWHALAAIALTLILARAVVLG